MSFEIRKYSIDFFEIWNDFISKSKNGTFLFHRNFMEYHGDRFIDFSLLVFKDEKLVAVLPANIVDNEIYSHQGLTYGGIIVSERLRSTDFVLIFQNVLQFLEGFNFTHLYIKDIPSFYTNQFSDEIKYLQFVLDAEIYRKDICSVINLSESFHISKSVKRDFNISVKKNHKIDYDGNFDLLCNEILEPNLMNTFQTNPVHSLKEILYLKNLFPENIRQINVFSEEGKILGGTTLFISKNVVHSQYISLNKDIANEGVLDFLHLSLIEYFKNEKKYFDFGISNENQGRNINKGLLFWKEKFGARPAIQEFYKFETKSFSKLDHLYL